MNDGDPPPSSPAMAPDPPVDAVPAPVPVQSSPQPPGSVEPGSEAPVAPKKPFAERVREATRGTYERFGTMFRRGPGAPRKDGLPKVNDVPLEAAETTLPAGGGFPDEPGSPIFDYRAVKKIWRTAIRTIFSWWDKADQKALRELSGDKEWAAEVVRENALLDSEEDACGEVAAQLGAYFKANSQMMIVSAGVVTVGGIFARRILNTQDIRAQLREKRQAEQAARDPENFSNAK